MVVAFLLGILTTLLLRNIQMGWLYVTLVETDPAPFIKNAHSHTHTVQ